MKALPHAGPPAQRVGLRRPLRWSGSDPGACRAAFAPPVRMRPREGVFEEKTRKGDPNEFGLLENCELLVKLLVTEGCVIRGDDLAAIKRLEEGENFLHDDPVAVPELFGAQVLVAALENSVWAGGALVHAFGRVVVEARVGEEEDHQNDLLVERRLAKASSLRL